MRWQGTVIFADGFSSHFNFERYVEGDVDSVVKPICLGCILSIYRMMKVRS